MRSKKRLKRIVANIGIVFFLVTILTSNVVGLYNGSMLSNEMKESAEVKESVTDDVYNSLTDINQLGVVGEGQKRIIVKYKDTTKEKDKVNMINSVKKDLNLKKMELRKQIKSNKMDVFEFDAGNDIKKVIEELKKNKNVEYAEEDYALELYDMPSDSGFSNQWGLYNNGQVIDGQAGTSDVDINIAEAWNITKGSGEVVVAIMDSGVDINHPDLKDNIYVNPEEIPGDGLDNDGNSLVDDVSGWDFANNDATVYDSATDDRHGTCVAGIVAGLENGDGICGVASNVKILPVKFITGNSGFVSDAISAITYCEEMGVDIVNCSFGSSENSIALKQAMEESSLLFVTAAGNTGADTSSIKTYPACYDIPNKISVASIDNRGNLASYSSYGSEIDVAAPGSNIYSTIPEGGYDYMSGTSMACAMVSGIAALLKSNDANLSTSEIIDRIKNNVVASNKLSGKVDSGGRVDAKAALVNIVPEAEEDVVTPTPTGTEKNIQDIINAPYDNSLEGNGKVLKPLVPDNNEIIIADKDLPDLQNSGLDTVRNDIGVQNVSTLSYIYEIEPNDNSSTGMLIGIGTVYGTILSSDYNDWYIVDLEAGRPYTISLKGINLGNDFDLYLYDSSLLEVDAGINGGNADEVIAFTPQTSGYYYIRVSRYILTNNNGDYQLMVYPNDTAPDSYEPNDSLATASAITDGATVNGNININTDEDWYVINAATCGKLTVTLSGIPAGCDYDIGVYNSNFQVLGGSYFVNRDEKVDIMVENPSNYYIRVYSCSGSDPLSDYSLKADVCIPDSYEINDDKDTAANIYEGNTISATIDNFKDEDWFKFTVNEAETYVFELKNILIGNDYDLYIYDEYKNYLGSSSYAGNSDESVSLSLNSGVYYVQIYSWSGYSESSEYILSVKKKPSIALLLDKTTASKGEIITATLRIKDIQNFAAYQASIEYNPFVVQPITPSTGEAYGINTEPQAGTIWDANFDTFSVASNDIYKGCLNFGGGYLDTEELAQVENLNTTGDIAVISFKVLLDYKIDIRIVEDDLKVKLFDKDNNTVPCNEYYIQQPNQVNSNLTEFVSLIGDNMSIMNIEKNKQQVQTLENNTYRLTGRLKSYGALVGREGFKVQVEDQSYVITGTDGYFTLDVAASPGELITLIISKDRYLTREVEIQADLLSTVSDNILSDIEMTIVDVNLDGVHDVRDYVLIRDCILGKPFKEEYDVDLNGYVRINDAVIVRDFIFRSYSEQNSIMEVMKIKLTENKTMDSLYLRDTILDLNGYKLNVNGNVTMINSQLKLNGGDLVVGTEESDGNVYVDGGISYGADSLNRQRPLIDLSGGNMYVKNDFVIYAGSVDVNGGYLEVNGQFKLGSAGEIKMTNCSDYVRVKGDFIAESQRKYGGCYNAGLLEVNGNFTVNGNNEQNQFVAVGSHMVLFLREDNETQVIDMFRPSNPNAFNIVLLDADKSYDFRPEGSTFWKLMLDVDDLLKYLDEHNDKNTPSGGYNKIFTDLVSNGPGIDVAFTRKYSSEKDIEGEGGSFGQGWYFGFDSNLKSIGTNEGEAYEVEMPDGSLNIFIEQGENTNEYDGVFSRSELTKVNTGLFIITTKDHYNYYYEGSDTNGYNLTKIVDRVGNYLTITQSGTNKIVEDITGRQYIIKYNADNKIYEIEDLKAQREVCYSYDNNGKLSTVTDPMMKATAFQYNTNTGLLETILLNSNVYEQIVYEDNKLKSIEDELGRIREYNYEEGKTTITEKDSNNEDVALRQTIFEYDSALTYQKRTVKDLYNIGEEEYSEVEYGAGKMLGEQRSLTDIYGNKTTYQTDSNGNIEVIINPDGSTKEFGYDENSNMVWEKDEEGNFTLYVYSGNLLIRKAKHLQKVAASGRDEYPDASSINETDYEITDYEYYPYSDSPNNDTTYKVYGLLKSETVQMPDADIVTLYNYYADGTLEWVKDPETGLNTVYALTDYTTYSGGWIKKEISPGNHETDYYYNKNGQLVKKVLNANVSGEESITVTRYDEFGRKKQEISANLCEEYGSSIPENVGYRYTYEGGKNLVDTVTDPENNTTRYEYDIFGNLIKEIKPDGAVYEYKYDVLNRQTGLYFRKSENDSQKLLVEYNYSVEAVPAQNCSISVKDLTKYFSDSDFATYTYKNDYAGRIVYQGNPDGGSIEIAYYNNGKVKSQSDVKNCTLKTYYKYNQYSSEGNYDEKWTPFKVLDDGSVKYMYTKTTYDRAGRISTVEVENDREGVTYDETANNGEGDGTRPANFFTTTYTYYKNGKVQKIETSNNKVTEYVYDADGKVNSETVTADNGKTIQTSYINNYLGKPDSKTLQVRKGDLHGNNFDMDNTLESVTTQYLYDKNGNLTKLTEPLSSGESVVTDYGYDNMDRCIYSKQDGVDENGSSVAIISNTQYNWEGKPLYVTDANGNTTKYVYDERGFKTKVISGSIVVGTTDAGFSKTGSWQSGAGGFRGGNSYHATVSSITATWKPQISEPGNYKVYVRYPSSGLDTNAQYTIEDSMATQTVYIDQTTNADKWVELGTYSFAKGNSGYVMLTSANAGTFADAVMFEPVDGYTTAYYYDMAGRVTDEVSAKDYAAGAEKTDMNRTTYTYDEMDRLQTKGYVGMEKQINTSSWTEYDSTLNVVLQARKYDYGGNVIKELDALGYEAGTGTTVDEKINSGYGTEYTYTPLNQVETMVDPENKANSITYSMKYSYDTLERKVFESSVQGYDSSSKSYAGTWCEYDDTEHSMLVRVGDEAAGEQGAQKVRKEYYDYLGRLIMAEDGNSLNAASSSYTNYEYNEFNQLRKVTYPSDATISQRVVCYQYDYSGTLIKQFENYNMKNAAGTEDSVTKVDLYTYDKQKRVTRHDQYDANNEAATKISTQNRYDRNGNVRFTVDGRGNETEYVYDSLNRLDCLVLEFTRDGEDIEHKTSMSYDRNGNVIESKREVIVTGTGSSTATITQKFSYDSLNRLYRKQDSEDNTIQWLDYYRNGMQRYSYDAPNVINGTTFRRTEFRYDKNGRIIRTIDPLNTYDSQLTFNHLISYEISTYDYAGNIRTKSDGINTTEYLYDKFNRLYEVKNSATYEKTRYSYDYSGNLKFQEVLEDASETGNYQTIRKKEFVYNVVNKLVSSIVYYDGETNQKVETYKYYADGSIKEKMDKNGAVTTYIYDVHGRQKSQKAVKTGCTTVEITYEYDGNNNATTVKNYNGGTLTDTITRQYDPMNRVISKTVTGIGTVTYKYDIIPVRTGIEQGLTAEMSTDPKSNKTTKVYDKNGRLKYVIDGEANTGTISANYEYNSDGSVQSLTYQGGAKEEYTYWNDGQLKKLVNLKPGGTTMIDEYKYQYNAAHNQIRKTDSKGNTNYTYDKLNRLKTVTEPSGRYTAYEYDAAGNRDKETVIVGTKVTTKIYEYNELDWLTGVKVNNVLVASYSYDNNGNMTAVDQSSDMFYEYDLFNRMIAVKDANNSTIMGCTYNGEGYRVSKTTGGTTTRYLYEYSEVVLEVDGSNTTKGRNIYGTNLVNRTVGSSTFYYMYNGHGDVTALISQAGVVSGTYYYDAFGNILERTGNVDNSITYAGYQYDKETEVRDANGNVIETGLYYLNARMYDPKVARFLQEDTYTGDPNDPLSLNLYVYCHNDPIIYTDPTGHWIQGDSGRPVAVQMALLQLSDEWLIAKLAGQTNKMKSIEEMANEVRVDGYNHERVQDIVDFFIPSDYQHLSLDDSARIMEDNIRAVGQRILYSKDYFQVVDKQKEALYLKDGIITPEEWASMRNISYNLMYTKVAETDTNMPSTIAPILIVPPQSADPYDFEDDYNTGIPSNLDAGLNNVRRDAYITGCKGLLLFGQMEDAATLLLHFLENKGTTMQIDFGRMINQSTDAKNAQKKDIQNFVDAANNFAIDGKTVTIVSLIDNVVWENNDNLNWFAAVGAYTTWGHGSVTKNGNKIKTTFNYNMRDRYDWHKIKGGELQFLKGMQFEINGYKIGIGLVPNEWLDNMHKAGIAREFNTVGSQIYSLSWNVGGRPSIPSGIETGKLPFALK